METSKKTKDNKSCIFRANSIYTYVLSAILIITAGAFIFGVCHLFFTGGDTPYSRERVGEYLSFLIIPSLLSVFGILVGAVLNRLFTDKERTKLGLSSAQMLKIMYRRYDVYDFEPEVTSHIIVLKKKRRGIFLVTACLSIALISVFCVLAIFLPSHNVSDFNREVIKAILIVFPSTLIVIGFIYASSRLCEQAAAAELAILKEQTKGVKPDGAELRVPRIAPLAVILKFSACISLAIGTLASGILLFVKRFASTKTVCPGNLENFTFGVGAFLLAAILAVAAILTIYEVCAFIERRKVGASSRNSRVIGFLRLFILSLGIVFVVIGISNGGMRDVFAKAVAICTECIGLG